MPKEIKCLDKGHVILERFAGDDMSVVRAARISYGDQAPDEAKDKRLIEYMYENEHGSPFEHNLFTIRVKAPILVFRQWHRTRIGVSYNEQSARYSEMADEFYIPTIWRAQDTKNKQGSVSAPNIDHVSCTETIQKHSEESMRVYRELLRVGVAREMARMVLPVNLYSSMYFTANARSLMYFIALRSDIHAQAETRQYSHAMAVFLMKSMPWTWDAFTAYLHSRPKRDYTELWDYLAKYEKEIPA